MTWKQTIRIGAVAVAVGVAGYLLANLIPKTYSSDLVLYFPSGNGSSPASSLAPLLGAGGGGSDGGGTVTSLRGALSSPLVGSAPQTAIGILTSRSCYDAVDQALGLQQRWKKGRSATFRELKNKTNARVDKSGFVRVEATLEDPKLCADVVDAMLKHLRKRSGELTLNVSQRNRAFIEQRLTGSSERVDAARDRLENELAAGPVHELSAVDKTILETQVKLDEARIRQKSAATELASLESALESTIEPGKEYPKNLTALQGLGASTDQVNQALQTLTQQLQQRRIDLADAAKLYRADSPDYQALAKRYNSVDELVNRVLSREKELLKSGKAPQLIRARVELEALQTTVTEFEKVIAERRSLGSEVLRRTAGIEIARSRFQTALQSQATLQAELEMAKIAESRDPARFEVVDAPIVDPDPVAPRKATFGLLGFVLALVFQIWPIAARSKAD